MMDITSGVIQGAQKVVVYGPEGIGKSTFASQFPNPVFSDTEGSTKKLNVSRLPKPTSWTMLMEQAKYVKSNPTICNTYVIDTADWAERLCMEHVCSSRLPPKGKDVINGIEDFGYGKGYTYLEEEFGRLLNTLEEVVEKGVNVVLVAHAQMRKFEQPDELGAYDRWELKLEKKTAPLVKEWADMILFANYKTYVVNVDNQGAAKGKNKVQGGSRVMYTSHHACWDAKNRDSLPEEIEFDFKSISHCIPGSLFVSAQAQAPVSAPTSATASAPAHTPISAAAPEKAAEAPEAPAQKPEETTFTLSANDMSSLPKALTDLMTANRVNYTEIQQAVASKGYYPKDTPIQNYDPGFINGVLVAAWPQVYKIVLENRPNI